MTFFQINPNSLRYSFFKQEPCFPIELDKCVFESDCTGWASLDRFQVVKAFAFCVVQISIPASASKQKTHSLKTCFFCTLEAPFVLWKVLNAMSGARLLTKALLKVALVPKVQLTVCISPGLRLHFLYKHSWFLSLSINERFFRAIHRVLGTCCKFLRKRSLLRQCGAKFLANIFFAGLSNPRWLH